MKHHFGISVIEIRLSDTFAFGLCSSAGKEQGRERRSEHASAGSLLKTRTVPSEVDPVWLKGESLNGDVLHNKVSFQRRNQCCGALIHCMNLEARF